MIKSQVLTGGRMKAGGVKFADTPDEAAEHAEDVLELEINGHMPRGVLVDPKAEVKQEYYAGVVWDGIRKQPVMLFSDMGGIDIEEVAEKHPTTSAAGTSRTSCRSATSRPRRSIASAGVTGSRAQPARPDPHRLARLFVEYDMTLAEINPLGELEDGTFVALDAHMDMENEARPRQRRCSRSSASATRRRARRARRPRSRSPARRSTRWTTAAWPATSPSSTATSAS